MQNNNKFKQTEIGEIPEDLQIKQLQEVADFSNGFAFSSRNYVDSNSNTLPVFKMGNIDIGGGIKITGKEDFVPSEFSERLNNFLTRENDILMCMTDMKSSMNLLGHSARIRKEKFLVNQRVGIIRPKLNINEIYLYYFLNSPKYIEKLRATARSGVQVNLTTEAIKKSLIFYPSIHEQGQIASILSSLDEKIELNRKMNKTLEEIGKALFKRWFVDFEFPDKNGQPYKSNGGKMVDSELGEIPEGWEIKNLGEITEIKNGFAFKSEDYTGEGTLLLRTRNFAQSNYIIKDETVFLPENFYGNYKNFQLRKFDVLLVMVGASVGKMGFVTSNILPALQNQNMWNFRAKVFNNQIFVKFLVSKIVSENIGSASGSARDFFRKDFFRLINISYPKTKVLNGFNQTVIPLYEVLDKNQGEIESLTEIRNSLLPRLMSGRIKVYEEKTN